MKVGLEIIKTFVKIPIQIHSYKFIQEVHQYLATATTLIRDLPKDVFQGPPPQKH